MRMILIVVALVVIAGSAWYFAGMPGYAPATETATTPAATSDTTTPAADTTAPASLETP